MPALRKFIAMPPPMVPAPITPTFSIVRVGVSSGTSGILLAARSAKNAWRSAFDSRASASASMNSSRSNCDALVERLRDDAATASTHFSGAGKFLAIAPDGVARELQEGFGVRVVDLAGRAPAAAAACRRPRSAKASAPRSRSPSMISSNSFWPGSFASSSDCTGSPETIMFSAVSRPTTRGRRCVPPAPGSRPSLTSGSAICAPGAATR